jgi:hypothetical protein
VDNGLATLAVVGTFGGVVLGRILETKSQVQSDVRAKLWEMYIAWMTFIDGIPERNIQAIISGNVDAYTRQFPQQLREVTTQVDLVGSKKVVRAWNKLRARLATNELDEALRAEMAKGTPGDWALRRSFREHIENERLDLVIAARGSGHVKKQ